MCGYLYLCRTYYAYHELCPLLRVQKALSKVCGAWIIGRRGGVGMAYGLVFQVGGGGGHVSVCDFACRRVGSALEVVCSVTGVPGGTMSLYSVV